MRSSHLRIRPRMMVLCLKVEVERWDPGSTPAGLVIEGHSKNSMRLVEATTTRLHRRETKKQPRWSCNAISRRRSQMLYKLYTPQSHHLCKDKSATLRLSHDPAKSQPVSSITFPRIRLFASNLRTNPIYPQGL
jgi:hypothetical protein